MIELKPYDEDISQNSFFKALQQKSSAIYRSAMKNGWLVCVPKTGTYDLKFYTDEDFLSHVLVPMNESDLQTYTTLSDKKVTIEDRMIVTGAGFSTNQTIAILFEETFYEGVNSRCRIACIESPLQGELRSDRSSSNAPGSLGTASVDLAQIRNFEDSEIILFSDGGPRLREHIEKAVRSYCNNLDVLAPPYELRNLIELTQALFGSILQMVQRDVSARKKKKDDQHYMDSIKLAVETYVLQKVYNKLFPRLCSAVAHKDAKLNKITRNLSSLELKDLGIQPEFSDNVIKARRALLDLPGYGSPVAKRTCLKSAAMALMQRPRMLTSSDSSPLTTDDLLSLLTFTILRSDIPNWKANHIYMSDLHFSKITDDEFGFYVSSLEAALKYLKMNCLVPGHRPSLNLAESPPVIGNARPSTWAVSPSSTELEVLRLFKAVASSDSSAIKELLSASSEVAGEGGGSAAEGRLVSQQSAEDKCHPLCTCERCTSLELGLRGAALPRRATVRSRDDQGLTALHVAATTGDPDILEYLLQCGAAVDACDYRGRTPLHWSCLKGVQSSTLLLLTSGASVQQKDDEGNTPLHLAAANGHGECVKALLYQTESAAVINLNAANGRGDTALHVAARWCYEEIVEMLTQHGASTEVRNKKKQTPAMCTSSLSIARALTDAARRACENNGFVLVDARPLRSASDSIMDEVMGTSASASRRASVLAPSTAVDPARRRLSTTSASTVLPPAVKKLLTAVADNDLNMVRYLLAWPDDDVASPETSGDRDGVSKPCHPLCQCSTCSSQQGVTVLPSAVVSVNACDEHGKTCLHYAVERGNSHESLLLALLNHGADVNAQMSSGGLTPLHLACQQPKPSARVVQMLIDHGCKANVRDQQGHAPLHYVSCRNSLECARVLLDGGANVSAVDKRGNTPLHYAVKSDSVALTRLLLQHGADANVRNRECIVPSQLAQCREIEQLLQQRQQQLLLLPAAPRTEQIAQTSEGKAVTATTASPQRSLPSSFSDGSTVDAGVAPIVPLNEAQLPMPDLPSVKL